MSDASGEITYGNLIKPRLPGFWKFGLGSTLVLVISAVMVMVLVGVLQQLLLGLIWAVVTAVVVVPSAFPRKDGYDRYTMFFRRRKHAKAQRAGKTALRQGLSGHVPDGKCRLPGLGATTHLESHRDVHGRDFGLVCWPQQELFTVVIEAFPHGFDGVDQDTIDGYCEHWALWLSRLNTVEEIVGASVVVETVPDSGRRLVRAIRRGQVENSPELSRAVSNQVLESYNTGTPQTTVHATLTLSATAPGDDDEPSRTSEEMATMIGDLLPNWTSSLEMTGAGTSARPCTAQEITDNTRVAFDPSVAELVEEAQLQAGAVGSGSDGTGLVWSDAGPIAAQNEWDYYAHENSLSRTWQMQEPPRGVFFAQTLRQMLLPHKDIARKRVTLMYRPESAQVSANAAERDVKNARTRATQGRHRNASDATEVAAAERNTKQVAEGSPLIRVGLLVTVTVGSVEELRRASRAVKMGLAGQARIALRLPKGAQDSAFLSSLPLGVVPHAAMRIPGKSDLSDRMESI